MVYDVLGRMTQRNEPDLISTWTYDNCTKGIGKLCASSSNNGTARSVVYDSLGRVQSTTTSLDTPQTVSVSYDANGRPDTTTYPTGFATRNVYTSLGYLQKVTRSDASITYWEALTVSATGKILSEKQGNNVVTRRAYDEVERLVGVVADVNDAPQHNVLWKGYVYDTIGNVTVRGDGSGGNGTVLTGEYFAYDTLNRLLSVTGWGPGITAKSVTYAANGNITSKSDIGAYTYGSARPHAVTQAGGFTLSGYDANGNLTLYTTPDGVTRTDTFTSYNMLASMTMTGKSLSYLYNGEHQRIREIRTINSVTTTLYSLHPDNQGGLFYEKEISGSSTRHKHYITGGSGVIALVISGSENRTEYWHKDALGSIVAVSNEAGTVTRRTQYDPWGMTGGGLNDGDRGFTGHEMLDSFGIVNMNGRTYIGALGRFMSADPFVQAPNDLQNYNRYSYVNNNPLGYTDPSGYFSLKSWVSAVVKKGRSTSSKGSGLGCGMAMSHVPAGESPVQITASHGSGIEPCRFTGNGGLDA